MTLSLGLLRSGVRRRRCTLLAACAALLLASCASDAPTSPPPPPEPPTFSALDGDWRALYWIAELPGSDSLDVITAGGSITLHIADGAVSGRMFVPAAVTQGSDVTLDMAGVVRAVDDSVRFEQTEDTFMQRTGWRLLEGELFDALVLDHVDVESTVFTVVLVRGW